MGTLCRLNALGNKKDSPSKRGAREIMGFHIVEHSGALCMETDLRRF